jgi:hypothetical protein
VAESIPPATSTFPFGKSVAVWPPRGASKVDADKNPDATTVTAASALAPASATLAASTW